jgi:hypothetical protein
MKKLTLLFSLVAFSVTAQIKVGKCQSYYADKQLSKQIFDSVNAYRNSLGEASYVWEENYYVTAKTQNDYLADNGLWGHRTNYMPGTELIVGVCGIRQEVTRDLYKMIIDSCIQQWIHSDWHHKTMKAPILTTTATNSKIEISGVILNIILNKFGAISINVLDYGTYKNIYCIFHLGFYKDPYKRLETPYKG